MKKQALVVFSGYAVLAAVALMLLSTAFLRGGHPPGYGIVNLLLLVLAYPLSVYGSIVGLNTATTAVQVSTKRYFVMVGACLSFSSSATMLFVLKYIFGKAI